MVAAMRDRDDLTEHGMPFLIIAGAFALWCALAVWGWAVLP